MGLSNAFCLGFPTLSHRKDHFVLASNKCFFFMDHHFVLVHKKNSKKELYQYLAMLAEEAWQTMHHWQCCYISYIIIIIHLKYFSLCFWSTQMNELFIITSYCRPNLEEFCKVWKMMSIVQHNCQKTEQCNQEDLGGEDQCNQDHLTSYFGSEYKMAEHFTRFKRKK